MIDLKRASATASLETNGRLRMPLLEMKSAYVAILSIVTGLVTWQILSDYLVANSLFLASPTQVLDALVSLSVSGELWPHLGTSALEFVLGYTIASIVGIAVGLLMATSPVLSSPSCSGRASGLAGWSASRRIASICPISSPP
jgi:hypothetical protein